jgi:hypothetical protein
MQKMGWSKVLTGSGNCVEPQGAESFDALGNATVVIAGTSVDLYIRPTFGI